MRINLATSCGIAILVCSTTIGAESPAVNLEIAADPKAPFGAQQKWHDALKRLNLSSLRLRQARPREEPRIESGGSERRPTLRVVAILDTKGRLQLPGADFTQSEAERLAQYLQTLRDEGVDGVTASRGRFGLTDKQSREVLEELAEVLGYSTKDKRPRDLVDALADRLKFRLVVEPELLPQLNAAGPIMAELEGLSRGTTLAILLNEAQLTFRPQVYSGELRYRIERKGDKQHKPTELRFRDLLDERPESLGNAAALSTWPIGWAPESSPVRTAPDLFEQINAQIGGYSLTEALEAISPRLSIPLIFDQTSLISRRIEPDKEPVELPAGEYSYFQILERILYQADLKGTLRVDERGVPFYWIRPESIGHRSTTNR